MTSVFLATLPVIGYLPPQATTFPGMTAMTWTSWEGYQFSLLGDGGVLLTNSGVRGLNMPQVDQFTSESASVAGAAYRGYRAKPRSIFWPTFIYSDASSDAWLGLDRAWWRSMRPDREGTWSVTVAGATRTIACRWVDDGDHAFANDPLMAGWSLYAIRMVANDPFWKGAPIERVFTSTTPQTFFSTTGVLNISSGSDVSTASISNTGDVDAWPVYTLYGGPVSPMTTASVGIGSSQIVVPFPVAAGHALVIDTDPKVQTAMDATWFIDSNGNRVVTLTGTELTGSLGAADFMPVPPADPQSLNLTTTGVGAVGVSLTPRFWRPW